MLKLLLFIIIAQSYNYDIDNLINVALDNNINIDERCNAIQKIGIQKNKESVLILSQLFINENNACIRSCIAVALGRIKDGRAAPYLINSLKIDCCDETSRYFVARSLGDIKDNVSITALKEIYNLEKSGIVKIGLAGALVKIAKDEDAVGYLLHRLLQSKNDMTTALEISEVNDGSLDDLFMYVVLNKYYSSFIRYTLLKSVKNHKLYIDQLKMIDLENNNDNYNNEFKKYIDDIINNNKSGDESVWIYYIICLLIIILAIIFGRKLWRKTNKENYDLSGKV